MNQQNIQNQIEEKILSERKILLWGDVNEANAKYVFDRLMYLELDNPGKEIQLLINSGGGSLNYGMAIHDLMMGLKSPVSTICIGQAMSMASVILSAGKKGRRFILPYGEVMIHQPSWEIEGQTTDLEIKTRMLKKIKILGAEILAKNCNQPLEKVLKDLDRDYYLDSNEAVTYGIVDHVVESIF